MPPLRITLSEVFRFRTGCPSGNTERAKAPLATTMWRSSASPKKCWKPTKTDLVCGCPLSTSSLLKLKTCSITSWRLMIQPRPSSRSCFSIYRSLIKTKMHFTAAVRPCLPQIPASVHSLPQKSRSGFRLKAAGSTPKISRPLLMTRPPNTLRTTAMPLLPKTEPLGSAAPFCRNSWTATASWTLNSSLPDIWARQKFSL